MNQEKTWYRAYVKAAHVGGGRSGEKKIYLYTTDIVSAMKLLTGPVRGWKRTNAGILKIDECTPPEVEDVKRAIRECREVTLEHVMRIGYFYADRRH